MAKLIPLTQGQFAIVDDEDFDWLNQWKWFAAWDPSRNAFYVQRSQWMGKGKVRTIKMHRLILPVRRVDHRDGNSLNNQRSNLRFASARGNTRNSKVYSNNQSGFKGVRQIRGMRARPFAARITIKGKTFWLDYFPTPEEAAHAYDRAALKYFGKFARLNFPPEQPDGNNA